MSFQNGNPQSYSYRVSSPFSEIEDLPTEMIYEQGGVSQKVVSSHSSGRRARHEIMVPGKLLITQNNRGTYIEWKADGNSESSGWSSTHGYSNGVGYNASIDQAEVVFSEPCPSNVEHSRTVKLDLAEIRSFLITNPKYGAHEELVIYLADGSLQNSFVFNRGSPGYIIDALRRFVVLEQPHKSKKSYIVKPRRESLASPPSIADLLPDSARSVLGYVNDFTKDPKAFSTTMLAKVGGVVVNSAHDYLNSQLNLSPTSFSPPPEEVTRESQTKVPDADYTTNDEGYEVVFKPDKFIELSPLPKTFRGQPLSQEQWLDYMDNSGRIKNFEEIKTIVFRGGVDPNIKKPVWPFLLGLYNSTSSYDERKMIFRDKSQDYKRIKNQWMTITLDQEDRFHAFRDFKSLIEKDVARTDRTLDFFKGDNNQGTMTLHNILMTYMMYNFNLGYVQGMSDILAPILMEVQDEVEAFWLFVKFMDRINSNFEMSQEGMKQQLSDMYTILQIVDPMFSAYLDACDASNMFFAFRWMLILFKREFSTLDTLTLWEAIWTELPGPNFHLVFAVAILEVHRNTLMENKYGLSEILRHLNDLSLRIDLEEALKLGESIYLQLLENKDKLPKRALEILGLPISEEPVSSQADELRLAVLQSSSSDHDSNSSMSVPSCSAIQLDEDDRLESQYEISISQLM